MKHKVSSLALIVLNIISFAGGVITQVKIATNSDFYSVIPIPVGLQLTSWQILELNLMVVIILVTLICLAVSKVVCDAPYSIGEIISNCAGIFLVVPVLTLFVAIFNAINTPLLIDKITIIICAIVHILLSVISVGSALTIKDDKDL